MERWLQAALEEKDSSEEKDAGTNKEWETIQFHALTLTTNKDATTGRLLDALATEAIQEGSTTWGATQAEKWGTDAGGKQFEIPLERLFSDARFIEHHKDIALAAWARWRELAAGENGRITIATVRMTLSANNPHREAAERIAGDGGGVEIYVSEDCRPNDEGGGPLPRISANRTRLGGALQRMVHDGYDTTGLAFVLTKKDAARLVPGRHYNPCQWAPKDGKAQGRCCVNCSEGGESPRKPTSELGMAQGPGTGESRSHTPSDFGDDSGNGHSFRADSGGQRTRGAPGTHFEDGFEGSVHNTDDSGTRRTPHGERTAWGYRGLLHGEDIRMGSHAFLLQHRDEGNMLGASGRNGVCSI